MRRQRAEGYLERDRVVAGWSGSYDSIGQLDGEVQDGTAVQSAQGDLGDEILSAVESGWFQIQDGDAVRRHALRARDVTFNTACDGRRTGPFSWQTSGRITLAGDRAVLSKLLQRCQ
ncbi:hypothetical protein AU198_19015 [Mycobacterium sp. GA-1199]|nr:hypothetical protein AU198_19015 [Mycobacterium sp. GA-1199]